MVIAFVSFTGLRSVGSWPETAASMAKAFERSGHRVVRIQPDGIDRPIYWQARKALYRLVGQQFQTERHDRVAHQLAASVQRQLRGLQPDLVLCSSSLTVPFLETDRPLAFWTDATFAGMLGFYPEFSRMSKETVRSGMSMEAKALARTDMAFYASEWAARSAVADHGADPLKVHVVPFGPNLENEPDHDAVIAAIKARGRNLCKLLFIGYDWERKQGALAVRVRDDMERRGIPTELTVIGCTPDLPSGQRGVRVLGQLDRSRPAEFANLAKALRESHFLLVPSKAECYGMVYAEASAHGLPSIAYDVGGVGTVVRPERNGMLFPLGTGPRTIAEWTASTWSDGARYERLAIGSRNEFEERLNWEAAAEAVLAVLRSTALQRSA